MLHPLSLLSEYLAWGWKGLWMAGGNGGKKTGREVGVKLYRLLLEGNSEMEEGEREDGRHESRQLW